ncbi:beta-ketoacyl synthase chain length factor [Pseudoalteromonas sp. MMG010]|uniref:beta-ketoacyl synthase chain length factor n=1 Tax=Pseudoalteromonas sp. MMG010 TaxID=2822685 RepID=UPI001B39E0FE|nr:beta-ketoacyl synthase chain length factor [Pseudoalteromonas sp. MMG010]MBQ4833484.1 beta-ketoacyl synthase chain length factor [Pseudoalteromonas sp. MMG010]
MQFVISKCVAWGDGKTSTQDWQQYAQNLVTQSQSLPLPTLTQMPAMQRRRLSAFAKITLHCALEASGDYQHDIASVFSSRHGDLHKTTKLISDVADKEALSPTHFGLSVHNAVGGLFSIFTKNKAPLSAVAAGEDSFFMGLVDAIAKMQRYGYPRILYVYSDQGVPEHYQQYVKQQPDNIAVALLIEPGNNSANFELNFTSQIPNLDEESSQLQALDFLRFYYGDSSQLTIESKRFNWSLSRNEK